MSKSENVKITPLDIKFTYNFFNRGKRTIKLTFMSRKNDFSIIRIFISNLPKNFGFHQSIEIINYHQKLINEPININIFDCINCLIFFFIIIEKVYSIFPYHFNPLGREIYDYLTVNRDINLSKFN